MTTGADLLALSPVLPVVVLDEAEQAVPLARALLRGGLRVIELTLRTPAALAAIERVAAEVPDIVVGAGTVTTPEQAEQATKAGAAFLVTPGCTDRLLDAVAETGLPFLPGVSTVSEALRAAERGLSALKFFPAEASGGVAYLRAMGGPLPGLRFCPTGGVTPGNAPEYLALPNVGCVGGTWLTPKEALAAGDFARIGALAAKAAGLRQAAG
ncbi:bifunctional 4-hydroxy-2-oxoglutarate aldolase/2-dehydro-3-deoxy-phosphogluconate aldolase [Gandjariella thermophila]|uniref:2-dehydro-3-deoxy-phosphogluconate aldolase n=1 Tax=Gandjariella thermophila TaxID=1931992 RepID=A0A4D4J4F5_9PSEU|nr:bifunctional 4-hydroxy-2-oxoglutarate aldolase/2-dehydro-3-deoxy-phosphogluconate aldolase [Gandjariella thermophila]GDY30344.1 2-dehydro-3-deoxy-phosphogluconate aldolase [Gandjariella thermophila]